MGVYEIALGVAFGMILYNMALAATLLVGTVLRYLMTRISK